jgi:hypothetical protein
MAQALERSNNNLAREIGLVRQQAVQVAESASQITLTANEWLKALKNSYACSKEQQPSPMRWLLP